MFMVNKSVHFDDLKTVPNLEFCLVSLLLRSKITLNDFKNVSELLDLNKNEFLVKDVIRRINLMIC